MHDPVPNSAQAMFPRVGSYATDDLGNRLSMIAEPGSRLGSRIAAFGDEAKARLGRSNPLDLAGQAPTQASFGRENGELYAR